MIRAATGADAPALAEIQARAWRWAYSDFVDHDDMPVAGERLARCHADVVGGGVRVFDQDGAVVGYASVHDDQLTSLYVDPPAQGAGVGGRLLEDAEGRLRAGGHALAWLWVFTANAQGRAFYERRGWRAVGEPYRAEHWVGDAQRYERAL
ncbi:MAG: GNAT family N-acetyltransferase [Actinomycetota bacterium]|nr:GNAT family N-acetyltransferase [Actinomycetota bacterium]